MLEMLSGSNLKHLPLTAKDINLFCDRLVNRLKGYRACNVHNQLDNHNQNTYNVIQFWSFGNTKNVKRREELKKKQSCIISQISHFAKDFFGSSLCLPPPVWLSPHSVSLSLLTHPSHGLWGMPWRAAGFVCTLFVCGTEAVFLTSCWGCLRGGERKLRLALRQRRHSQPSSWIYRRVTQPLHRIPISLFPSSLCTSSSCTWGFVWY